MRAAVTSGVLVALLCGCSTADEAPVPSLARPVVWARANQSLRVFGPAGGVVEETPEPPVSIGPEPRAAGSPETPAEARLPVAPVTLAEPDPGLPVRVPWSEVAPLDDDDTVAARPERIPLPERIAPPSAPSHPRRRRGPCCNAPCGVSSRGLAQLVRLGVR